MQSVSNWGEKMGKRAKGGTNWQKSNHQQQQLATLLYRDTSIENSDSFRRECLCQRTFLRGKESINLRHIQETEIEFLAKRRS
jgi:hypothetical protein